MTSRAATGALLLAAGALWLLALAGVVEPSYQASVGLLLVGIGLATALTRGPHGLLVALGVLVALAGAPALAAGDMAGGDVGDAVEAPASVAEITRYEHAIGKLTIDLTAPGLADDELEVEAEIGIGELLVLVPPDADVAVDVHVGVGEVDVLGQTEGGVGVDRFLRFAGTRGQPVSLRLEAGVGAIRIERR